MLRVAVANLTAKVNSVNLGPGMWLVKSFLKKFHDCWPLTEYMATWSVWEYWLFQKPCRYHFITQNDLIINVLDTLYYTNHISRVHAISEELEAHPGAGHEHCGRWQGLEGAWEPHYAMTCSLLAKFYFQASQIWQPGFEHYAYGISPPGWQILQLRGPSQLTWKTITNLYNRWDKKASMYCIAAS